MKKNLPLLIVITLIAAFLISAIFHSGWYTSHDGVYHILRTEESLRMLKLGNIPLRWAATLDQGFGIPLFTFIYPLPYYLTAILATVMSSVSAVKTLIFFSYVLGGFGIYYFARERGRLIAMTVALIYLMTPYQFLNIFVRGALGEIVALGLIPWVMVAIDQVIKKNKVKWYHPLPLGLLLIAHNFLGILFTIFLAGYILVGRNKLAAIKMLVIGLCLAAFFLLPMIGERGFLYSLENQFFTFNYEQHYVALRQLLYSKWDYWYSLPGIDDGMSFQLGIAQISLVGLGGLTTILFGKRKLKDFYLLFAYTGSVILMTQYSDFIWKNIGILQTIQFPWRLLFMAAALTPIIGSSALAKITNRKVRIIICLFLIGVSWWNVRNYRRPMKHLTEAEYTDLYRLNLGKTTTTFRTEILPRWSPVNERYKSDEILVNSGNMTIDSLVFDPLHIDVTINNKPDEAAARVTILRNYYPGWSMKVDNQDKIELVPNQEGMITFSPILGIHTYHLRMSSTQLEKIGNAITVISLLTIIYLWIKRKV